MKPRNIIENNIDMSILVHNFHHINLLHLLFVMISTWNIGRKLETLFGQKNYMKLLLFSLILQNSLLLILSFLLNRLFDMSLFYHTYYYGFTGILLCLEQFYYCLLNRYINLNGCIIHSKYVPLIHLLFMFIITRGYGILSILSGILSGYILYQRNIDHLII